MTGRTNRHPSHYNSIQWAAFLQRDCSSAGGRFQALFRTKVAVVCRRETQQLGKVEIHKPMPRDSPCVGWAPGTHSRSEMSLISSQDLPASMFWILRPSSEAPSSSPHSSAVEDVWLELSEWSCCTWKCGFWRAGCLSWGYMSQFILSPISVGR